MSLFSTRQKQRNRTGNGAPSEEARVTENVIAQIWNSDDGRVNFAFSRYNPEGRAFRTFRASNFSEYVEGVQFMGSVLARVETLDPVVHAEVVELSKDLEEVVERAKQRALPNNANGPTASTGLLAAASHR